MKQNNTQKLVIFDCDGTLVDSARVHIEAMSMAWLAEGLGTPPSGDLIRSIVGLELVEGISRLHLDGDRDSHQRLADYYKEGYFKIRNSYECQEPLYDGAREAIEALHGAGVYLGIATGKSRRGLEALLARHDLLGWFVSLKTSDDGPGKPNPAILIDAMNELGVEPKDTVMIGDTVFDMHMASNGNVTAIGVKWGYHDVTELNLAGATIILTSFSELNGALETIWSRLRR